MKLLSTLLFMLCSFLNSSNFSYKMDTHFTVTNNQIEIPEDPGDIGDNQGQADSLTINPDEQAESLDINSWTGGAQ